MVRKARKHRTLKFSYAALKVLQKVWAASGGQCGKCLAVSMQVKRGGLERHGELVDGIGRYSPAVRAELLAMSPASTGRWLAPAKVKDRLRGRSTTKPSALLRSSIKVRKAGDEVETEPGFFKGDTVTYCGPTLKGEFARTVNLANAEVVLLSVGFGVAALCLICLKKSFWRWPILRARPVRGCWRWVWPPGWL